MKDETPLKKRSGVVYLALVSLAVIIITIIIIIIIQDNPVSAISTVIIHSKYFPDFDWLKAHA